MGVGGGGGGCVTVGVTTMVCQVGVGVISMVEDSTELEVDTTTDWETISVGIRRPAKFR